jgi:hypothetical protein
VESGFPDKMDALDLIINALKDHEKKLDEISEHMESVFGNRLVDERRVPRKEEPLMATPTIKGLLVICKEWIEFKDICRDAKVVTFEIEQNSLHLYAIVNGNVFKFSEEMPKIVEEFLSNELGVSKKDIIKGKVAS